MRRFVFLWLAGGTLSPGPGVALAQTQAADVQRYRPITPTQRGFDLERPATMRHLEAGGALDLDFASEPLRLDANPPSPSPFVPLERALGARALLGFGLWNRVEVVASLPVSIASDGASPPGFEGASGLGVGDLLLGARGLLFEQGPRGVSVGASFTATVPLGDRAFVNESGAGFEPRVSARYDARRFGFGVRFGYRMRTATSLYGTALDDEVTFALGGDARLFRTTRALAEIAGATAAQGDVFARRLTPVEALFGARRHLGRFSVAAGAGPGLVSGYGAPQFRALLSVAWQSVAPDADRDAVPDEHDRCPDDPEDRDGFEDGDGCPDPDDDADGIPDGDDRCPRDAEDLDGFEDLDGCPDPDNDGDGVPDATDRCPEELETPNGWQDDDGCADEIPDTDGDGILDNSDQCPNEAEDKDGFEDEDGCPDPDNDGDGVADAEDKCPTEAETINGNQDDDGCPDEGVAQVKLGEKELETLRPVFFKTDRSRIRRAFWSILDQVALMLKAHPEIGRCAVEGHADATGPDVWNQRLSVLRAESVVEYLVGKGVARQRLSAIGQGESKPWADNATEEGRTKNRRVVFHIEGVER